MPHSVPRSFRHDISTSPENHAHAYWQVVLCSQEIMYVYQARCIQNLALSPFMECFT